MSLHGKVILFMVNGKAHIWNSDDWLKVRKHRIMGNFSGNLAALPRQDFFEGLPLALLPEETTLLLEKNLAITKEVPDFAVLPSEDIKLKSYKTRKENLQGQVEVFNDLRKKELEEKINKIVEGKRLKRKIPEATADDEEILRKMVLKEEFEKIQPPDTANLSVQIFTSDPWIADQDYKNYSWKYPSTDREKLHYFVFKDLWERGHYVTPGGKFGADFLAYPGDPIKFHAQFLVICIENPSLLKPKKIIAYGRLSQSVRKTVALAFLSVNDVSYQSIQWTGL